jgi:hypothetical protein
MRACSIMAIMCCLLVFVGCDDRGDNYLEGSLTKSYDMKFDNVRVRLYEGSELSIEYVNDDSDGEKVPLRVTINITDVALAEGTTYDLAVHGTVGRGQGYSSGYLPELESGDLTLEKYSPENGSAVKGDFDAIFLETDGSKMTLRGGFSSDIDVVDMQ